MHQLIRQCRRFLLAPLPPQCFFSFSYFLSSKDAALAFHRQLFFSNFKLSFRGFAELLIYCRWLLYGVWISTWRISTHLSIEKQQEYGLTRYALFKDLLRWGFLHALTPRDYFKYELYNKHNCSWLMHYVFYSELSHFHKISNRNFKTHPSAITLIADKAKFNERLEQLNLPVIHTTAYFTNSLKKDFSVLFQRKNLFCKPNQASNSNDAFLVNYDEVSDCYHIEPIQGASLDNPKQITAYLNQVCNRHKQLIIQPYLEDHETLKVYNPQRSCTTFRVVTGKLTSTSLPQLLYLQMEIPKTRSVIDKKSKQFYDILPLHWETLDIDPIFQKKYPARCSNIKNISEPLKNLLKQGIADCIKVHEQLLDMCSVGFDLVITSDRSWILEANYNWSVPCLYQVLGDSPLREDHPAAHWLKSIFNKI